MLMCFIFSKSKLKLRHFKPKLKTQTSSVNNNISSQTLKPKTKTTKKTLDLLTQTPWLGLNLDKALAHLMNPGDDCKEKTTITTTTSASTTS